MIKYLSVVIIVIALSVLSFAQADNIKIDGLYLEKPTEIKNLAQKKVIINQVGWAGINLGRIDFYVTTKKSASYYQSSVQPVY